MLFLPKIVKFSKKIELITLNITYILFTIIITSIISKVIDTIISEVILPITENPENSFDNHLVPVLQKPLELLYGLWVLLLD